MGPLRYQSTTGLAGDQIEELVARIGQIVQGREGPLWPPSVALDDAVVITLVYVRQNLNQATMGDLFGISQPTVSRVYRGVLPLIGEALCLHVPNLAEVIRDRVTLIDGTDVPTGNRAGQDDNYSGKRHRSGLNLQVASGLGGCLLGVSVPMPGAMHDPSRVRRDRLGGDLLDQPGHRRPRLPGNQSRPHHARNHEKVNCPSATKQRTGRYQASDQPSNDASHI